MDYLCFKSQGQQRMQGREKNPAMEKNIKKKRVKKGAHLKML